MGWEILVHNFFFLVSISLSDFESKELNTHPSFLKFLLKFLLCNNTWKLILQVKYAFNLISFRICLKLCAVWFQVLCYIRENRLCCNTLLYQRPFSSCPVLINLLFKQLWSCGFFPSCGRISVPFTICIVSSQAAFCCSCIFLEQGQLKLNISVLFMLLKSIQQHSMQLLVGKKHVLIAAFF